MLVLSRKSGESIMIGDRIEVRIHKVDGDMVRLCIEAPREVAIYRKELFEEIRQTNREAAFKAKERKPLPKIDLVQNVSLPPATNKPVRNISHL